MQYTIVTQNIRRCSHMLYFLTKRVQENWVK